MSSLPNGWVESLFARFTVRYGQQWLRLWEGIDPEAVKADWSKQLAGFAGKPEAIAFGLDNLPDTPPMVGQFRAICNRAPEVAAKQLPAPKPDPARVAQALNGLALGGPNDPKQWARDLKAREERGGAGMTLFQRKAWREALIDELNNDPEKEA